MGLRPARTVRDNRGPAWTRYSKRKPRKSFVKSLPHKNLNTFETGIVKPDYDLRATLVCLDDTILVRDNAIEAGRQAVSRLLEKHAAGNYKFWVRKYPHQVIRENRMLSGAGADRLSKGMRKSFGKPSDLAARINKGDIIFEVRTYSRFRDLVADAYRRASQKMSGKYRPVIEAITPK
ncbi:MAG: 50S ribosomal protein L16 [Candidatus Micrarchaeota archaeon]|nr:50S ribosomal protein L16 [Candidatus Micrarchaeota archaeon]